MTPDRGCDHVDGSPMGVCAVCGKTVCSECYRTVFNDMICDEHEALEDESAWELVGIYTDPSVVADRRFLLEENGISSISVPSDEDAVELYVPADDKDEGFAVLQSGGEDLGVCSQCRIQYSIELEACPLCGGRQTETEPDAESE
jgi:RNA polymerase subunit RPABC4/transcription elongation factor Spt4